MGTIRVDIPADLQAAIDHQVAQGREPDTHSFLTEAARRYADELAWQEEVERQARLGIADIEAGRFVTITNRAEAEAWMRETMAEVRDRLAEDQA